MMLNANTNVDKNIGIDIGIYIRVEYRNAFDTAYVLLLFCMYANRFVRRRRSRRTQASQYCMRCGIPVTHAYSNADGLGIGKRIQILLTCGLALASSLENLLYPRYLCRIHGRFQVFIPHWNHVNPQHFCCIKIANLMFSFI